MVTIDEKQRPLLVVLLGDTPHCLRAFIRIQTYVARWIRHLQRRQNALLYLLVCERWIDDIERYSRGREMARRPTHVTSDLEGIPAFEPESIVVKNMYLVAIQES